MNAVSAMLGCFIKILSLSTTYQILRADRWSALLTFIVLKFVFLSDEMESKQKNDHAHGRTKHGIHGCYLCFAHSIKRYEHGTLQCENGYEGVSKGYVPQTYECA